ncbi:hypothetical protein B296_00052516 [Ensete ventricosum]|uniref:Uncharacterized protein n=1 Tax=Ensete ventricosum TaxID=4639 RepID=A0A426XIF1_ENSVE|nr:hypothetical protein B296_00052516 [Ensete ventricosum]
MATMVRQVVVDDEGRDPGPGWTTTSPSRSVFFLIVVKSDSGRGAGDELALGWIPVGSDCHGSIAECLAGNEFELGVEAEATLHILSISQDGKG